jgi:hypothetical protein
MQLNKSLHYLFASILWLITFFVYRMTMAPTIGFIDSGELSTVALSLGIAHPTGYPLFTLLARTFSLLPIASEQIVRLNIFSAVVTSLSVVIFFFLVLELSAQTREERNRWELLTAASISSMFIGFSKTFWFQGLAIEVYSLHLLLILSALLLFVKAVRSGSSHHWLLFAFVVGLAFTNHLTTILLAPAMLYWFFSEHGIGKSAFKKIGLLAVPFAAGLSVYLYLPLRAGQFPLLSWGDPQSAERLWWHVTGKQFRVFMFSSSEAARRQLSYFFDNLTVEFFFPVLILAAIGAVVLLVKERRAFIFIILLLITCVGYSINYDIHDIDSYFLLAFISIALLSAFGIRFLIMRFDGRTTRIVFAVIAAGIAGTQLYNNREVVDQSSNYLVEDYTMNILLNLPQKAVVISYQWDYFVAASYYYQHIKAVRPDVTVIDKELLRRSWYFSQLERMYPEVVGRSKQEILLFMAELDRFEKGLPYDYAMIEGRYTQLLRSFIEKNSDRSVFITPEIEPQYTEGYFRIPEGLVFRLSKETEYRAMVSPVFRFRDFHGSDDYSKQIKKLSKNALTLRAQYEESYGKSGPAAFFRQKASEIPVKY